MHVSPNSVLYAKCGHSISLSEHNNQLPHMYRPRSRYNLSSRGASFPAFVPDISVDMIDETRHRQVFIHRQSSGLIIHKLDIIFRACFKSLLLSIRMYFTGYICYNISHHQRYILPLN
jgi:hypothetical protein